MDRWLNKDEDQCQSKEKCNVTEGETGYPPFSVFCNFLQRGSRIACNPVTSDHRKKKSGKKTLIGKGGQMALIGETPRDRRPCNWFS